MTRKKEFFMSLNESRSFDLREKNPATSNKKGRKKKEFEITPNSIVPLVADWSTEAKNKYRKKLISNVPIEYISFLSHADSDSLKVLKAKDIITNEDISFKPAYFESDKNHQFNLLDLFTVQMTPENRVTTIFRAFSNSWCSQITSLPWRHNEIMALMTIYPFIEEHFYSRNDQKITIADLVKECSKKQEKREYIRSLYSLLILQDTDLLLVNSEKKIISASKKLFYIKSSIENVQSLQEELKDFYNNKYDNLMSVLEKFEVCFSTGSLFEIEKLHEHKTPEVPHGWVKLQSNTKPSWKPKVFKGGHLFHVPHPNLNVGNHVIRAWMLLSAYQPQGRSLFKDLVKSFNFDTFIAILGLVNVQQHKPEVFKKYLNQISNYWGSFEVKNKNIHIKYGFSEKLKQDLLKDPDQTDVLDLNYGYLANSMEENQKAIRSIPFSQLTEIFTSNGSNDSTAKFCSTKVLASEKREKFTGSEINTSNFNAFSEPPKGGEIRSTNPQKGGNTTHLNPQKGEKYSLLTPKRGELNPQKGGNGRLETFIDADNSSLETVKETNIRDYSLTRDRSDSGVNEKKKLGNDLSNHTLRARIDLFQNKIIGGYNGNQIREKFLKALEKGTRPLILSKELEKMEKFLTYNENIVN
jgi:hypothetical protein